MRLINFRCRGLNAFLDYEFRFFDDVSFFHGINGSGKTSVLRAIAALLTPDPVWLVNTEYEYVVVDIEHQEKLYTVSANRHGDHLVFSVTGAESHEQALPIDSMRSLLRQTEDEYYRSPEEFDQRLRTVLNTGAAFKFIMSLPTPIFLGLDRTTLTPGGWSRGSQRFPRGRSVHYYFRTQMDDAIAEAAVLLSNAISAVSAERNRIFEKLRSQFALSLFQLPTENKFRDLRTGELRNLARYTEMRASVISALKNIKIDNSEIKEKVEPFFDSLVNAGEDAANAIDNLNKGKKKKGGMNEEVIKKVTAFLDYNPLIAIIEGTLSNIDEANQKDARASAVLKSYQDTMNDFLVDSRKKLIFDDNAVKLELPTGKITDLNSFSSGERQIFVLLTHLIFNPSMNSDNLLLIDEPELSLHLKWQRQFVPAIRRVSPSTQMVLATHSPEIIHDWRNNLIPLVL